MEYCYYFLVDLQQLYGFWFEFCGLCNYIQRLLERVEVLVHTKCSHAFQHWLLCTQSGFFVVFVIPAKSNISSDDLRLLSWMDATVTLSSLDINLAVFLF